jgi:peptidyl-prolyl cis-trans isomerase D
MSILEKLRSGQDSTFMQVVMVLIIVSFVGFMGQSGGDKGANIAVVNGVPITDIEYNRAFRQQSRQAGRALSDAESQRLGEEVRAQLVEQEILTQEAQRLGLEVSDTEVARVLVNSPGFKGADGKFDEELYLKQILQNGMTQDAFEQEVREQLLRQKLFQLVFLGASTSDQALRDAWIEQGTQVDLAVVRIRPIAMASSLALTDEVRSEWAKENETQITEAYERDKPRLYDHPETVRLRMIRLATGGAGGADVTARIEAVRSRVAAGEDMEALARSWSEDPSALKGGDLGARPVAELPADLSAAVSGLAAGGLSAVFATADDVRFVRVEERTPAKVDTLDEVRTSIIDRLIKEEKLPGMALEFAEQVLLPKWTESGVAPEALLAEKGLAVRQTGPQPLGGGGPGSPPEAVLLAARSAPVGSVLPKVYEEGGTLFVVQLTSRVEPDPAEFDANKDRLRESLLLDRRSKFYEAWVADLKARSAIEMRGS